MMHVLLAIIIFFIVVVIHLLIARQSRRGANSTGLFLFLACCGLMVLWIFVDAVSFIHSEHFLKSTATLMYLLLIPLYLRFYRSVNDVSPSSKICALLERYPEVSYEDLLASVKEERFVDQALETLVKAGQVRRKNDLLSLSFRGRFLGLFARLDGVFFKRASKGGR